MAFDDRINCKNFYDNYIYNREEAKQVLVFEAYNITAKLGIIYTSTTKYFNLQFSDKRQRLLTENFPKELKIATK